MIFDERMVASLEPFEKTTCLHCGRAGWAWKTALRRGHGRFCGGRCRKRYNKQNPSPVPKPDEDEYEPFRPVPESRIKPRRQGRKKLKDFPSGDRLSGETREGVATHARMLHDAGMTIPNISSVLDLLREEVEKIIKQYEKTKAKKSNEAQKRKAA